MRTPVKNMPHCKRACAILAITAAAFLLQPSIRAYADGAAGTLSVNPTYTSSALVQEAELKEAVINAEQMVTEEQKKIDEVQATVDTGSFGFYEWAGADAAVSVLKNSKYASMTKQGDSDDATSLEHMKESLEWLQEFNNLRTDLGLSQLQVSYESMAQAQADANYSDTVVAHSNQFESTAENLAWNYGPNDWGGVSDPYVQWYDDEKSAYDSGNRNFQEIGHYLNIINQEYDNTGFAVCTRGTMKGWNTYAQTFNTGRSDTCSLSEFTARFDEYYDIYVGDREKSLEEAQARLQDAEEAFAAGMIRVGGADRYKTMNSLLGGSDKKFETTFSSYSQTGDIVVVSGNDFADALSASSLAGICKTGIITTDTKGLDLDTVSVLQKAGVAHVAYVVGGEKAVPSLVEDQLKDLGYKVVRLSGADRFETALSVHAQTLILNGQGSTAIVASGTSYADALSIAPYAYAQDIPFFLTDTQGDMSDEAAAYFTADTSAYKTVLVVGGEQVVSAATQKMLENAGCKVTRLAGSDRYETNETINNWLDANSSTNSYAGNAVYIASGEGFADALAVAPVAGAEGSTVALVKSTNVAAATCALLHGALPVVVGGTSAVAPATLKQIAALS